MGRATMRTTLASILFTLIATPASADDTWTDFESRPRQAMDVAGPSNGSESRSGSGRGGGSSARFGIGAETTLSGLSFGSDNLSVGGGGLLLSYDARLWRVEGLFGMTSLGELIAVRGGGRLLFAVHDTERSDFSVGAGGYVIHASSNNDVTLGEIDLMAQLRAFLVENVALMASVGMSIVVGQGDPLITVGGQVSGSLGIVYYF